MPCFKVCEHPNLLLQITLLLLLQSTMYYDFTSNNISLPEEHVHFYLSVAVHVTHFLLSRDTWHNPKTEVLSGDSGYPVVFYVKNALGVHQATPNYVCRLFRNFWKCYIHPRGCRVRAMAKATTEQSYAQGILLTAFGARGVWRGWLLPIPPIPPQYIPQYCQGLGDPSE